MTLKDWYDARTRSGAEWEYASDDGVAVVGQVLQDGAWLGVTWIRTADGNLFSQSGRAYDVQRRVPPAAVQQVNRALDTDFVVHATRDAHVFYTVELTAVVLLSGTSEASVGLSVGGGLVAAVQNLLTMTLALGVTQTTTHQKVVSGVVLAGQTVRLVSTGTASLLASLEVLL